MKLGILRMAAFWCLLGGVLLLFPGCQPEESPSAVTTLPACSSEVSVDGIVNSELVLVSPTGQEQAVLKAGSGPIAAVAVKPDSREVALEIGAVREFDDGTGGVFELYEMSIDDSVPSPLIRSDSFRHSLGDPAWLPSGEGLLYVLQDANLEPQIMLRSLDGTMTPVQGARGVSPSPSPDGMQIAFVDKGTLSIVSLRPETYGEVSAFPFGLDVSFPSWSPDGRRIALTVGAGKTQRVRMFSLSDHEFIPGGFQGSAPSWSPDGDEVAFIRVNGTSSSVHIRNLPQGETIEVAEDPQLARPIWLADGDELGFLREQETETEC